MNESRLPRTQHGPSRKRCRHPARRSDLTNANGKHPPIRRASSPQRGSRVASCQAGTNAQTAARLSAKHRQTQRPAPHLQPPACACGLLQTGRVPDRSAGRRGWSGKHPLQTPYGHPLTARQSSASACQSEVRARCGFVPYLRRVMARGSGSGSSAATIGSGQRSGVLADYSRTELCKLLTYRQRDAADPPSGTHADTPGHASVRTAVRTGRKRPFRRPDGRLGCSPCKSYFWLGSAKTRALSPGAPRPIRTRSWFRR